MEALVHSPFGDVAVVDLAISALSKESLGTDEHPDLLSISLSSTDLIGHRFGPESRELEDQLVRLDRELERLLGELDRLQLTDNTLVVLSADHGGCESAEYLANQNVSARRLLESEVEAAAQSALKSNFGSDKLLRAVESPYVYLDPKVLARLGLDPALVRKKLARALALLPGVHSAYPTDTPGVNTQLQRLVSAAIHPERSGDIYVVPKPYVLFLQDAAMTATHGSPWSYDTHVPVVISRAGSEARSVEARVDVRSLAPTVAYLAGIAAPAAAAAPILPVEALTLE